VTRDPISTIATSSFNAFLAPVTKLILHIAENPLPSRMLDPIPSRLSPPQMTTGMITLIEAGTTSWWDKQKAGSGDIDDVCGIAILGMDLVRFGALLIRHSESLSTLDEFSISRAICRCTDAARVSFLFIF
jgi:hypothetical protein